MGEETAAELISRLIKHSIYRTVNWGFAVLVLGKVMAI